MEGMGGGMGHGIYMETVTEVWFSFIMSVGGFG